MRSQSTPPRGTLDRVLMVTLQVVASVLTVLRQLPAVTAASPPVPPDPVGHFDFPDPAAVFDGRRYHAFGGASTMTSADLQHWGPRPEYLARSPAWARDGSRGGAPSPPIRLPNGEWMIYYQADPKDCEQRPCGCIGAARSENGAGGPFVPTPEPVVCMPEEHGLVDGSARRVLLGSNESQPKSTVLYFKSTGFNTLARPARLWAGVLTNDGTRLAQPPINLLNQTAKWEARDGVGCIEAPSMLVQESEHTDVAPRFTLLYSGGDWTSGLNGLPYSIGYASCAGALGPCTKRTVDQPWFGPTFHGAVVCFVISQNYTAMPTFCLR